MARYLSGPRVGPAGSIHRLPNVPAFRKAVTSAASMPPVAQRRRIVDARWPPAVERISSNLAAPAVPESFRP